MKTTNNEIVVQPVNRKALKLRVKAIEGSTLITHRLDPETVEIFMKRETGTSAKKKLRDFDKEYESSFYYVGNPEDKVYGIPASAFMAAMLDAAVACNVPKTNIKRAIRVLGDIYPLEYEVLNRRIDNPRRGGRNGTPDIRHRPEFVNWSTDVMIEFDSNLISPEQIINLVNQSGFSSGVGDWRPSAPQSCGTHGMFTVETNKR